MYYDGAMCCFILSSAVLLSTFQPTLPSCALHPSCCNVAIVLAKVFLRARSEREVDEADDLIDFRNRNDNRRKIKLCTNLFQSFSRRFAACWHH